MQITTRYGINDSVYKINRKLTKKWIVCPACDGVGRVELKNGFRMCPDCYGNKGAWEYGSQAWAVQEEPLTIGQVRAYVQNFKKSGLFDNVGSYCEGTDSKKVEYMCYETGIGSGSLHYEETIWPSQEEAQAECARLNSIHQGG